MLKGMLPSSCRKVFFIGQPLIVEVVITMGRPVFPKRAGLVQQYQA